MTRANICNGVAIGPSASALLPLSGLLALATAAFITILTEALPAGLLPQMSSDLEISPSLVGQLVTAYAVGSLAAAIPLTAATQGLRRRPLLLAAIAGFAVANTVTAVSTDYGLTIAARFVAGVSAGLLWALVAGYAARMAPAHLRGRAIAIAMVGTPLALSLGIPAGTFLGTALGWRPLFLGMSGLTLLLIVWVLWQVPDFAGRADSRRASLREVFLLPGVAPILLVTLLFVLAHNILYTYIAPFLSVAGLGARVDIALLVFGVAALGGIALTGMLIDRRLRSLVLASTASFSAVSLVLGLCSAEPGAVLTAIAVWGLGFGGAATLFQTALAQAAGNAADLAQAMLVTVWNAAIAGGGLIGGLLLDELGVGSFPWALLALLVPTLLITLTSRRHGFPAV
ncbi:MFS transporter [Bosea sp. F3-2]|nr:MFS transporter [Bosea sp. F3-2]QEL26834.1 MFS transporter [Bosea sp. F3-2]